MDKTLDILLEGCSKLGSSLLNYYKLDGQKRTSNVNTRKIEREFDEIQCKIY